METRSLKEDNFLKDLINEGRDHIEQQSSLKVLALNLFLFVFFCMSDNIINIL